MENINIYKDLFALRSAFPGQTKLIEKENNLQYPNAQLIIAGYEEETEYEVNSMKYIEYSINAFFDIGRPNEVLWVEIRGDGDDYLINEYYSMEINSAKSSYKDIWSKIE